jgi:hypothetical protein
LLDHGEVEPGEMEDLEDTRVGHQRLEVRTVVVRPLEADDMRIPLPVRQLNNAQRVPERVEAHGFSVDGDRALELHMSRQVAFVMVDGQRRFSSNLREQWREIRPTATASPGQLSRPCREPGLSILIQRLAEVFQQG